MAETDIAAPPREEVRGSLAVIGTGGTTNVAPRNMQEVVEFAKLMSQAGPCVRQAFRGNPGACLALTLQALRWGMDPFAVSNKAYITTGKAGEQLAFEAQLVHAVVNERAPLSKRLRPIYTGEGQTRACKVIGWLKGENDSLDYESPMVKNIQVQNSPLWKSDVDQQLWYYSVRAWARKHVPEILLGVYTDDEIEAQERHYGPDGARDVTPPRPTRSDAVSLGEAEERPEPFVFQDSEGVVTEDITDAKDAAEAFNALIDAAPSADALQALWESNTLSAQLRDRGYADLAEAMLKFYADALSLHEKIARDKKAAETAKAAEKPVDPQAEHKDAGGAGDAGRPAQAEPWKPSPAPKSPMSGKDKGDWPTWARWFVEMIRAMPKDQLDGFMKANAREYDFIVHNRSSDADAIAAALDERRA